MRESNIFTNPALRPSIGGGSNAHHSNTPSAIPSSISSDRGGFIRTSNPRVDAGVLQISSQNADQGSFSDRGERSSRTGSPDGGHVRATGGRSSDGAPRFDQAVNSGGYLWWYIDAVSDDGQFGLSLIAFVGSVFSPYYAKAIQKGLNPLAANHCALNVALYTPKGKFWSMTERPQKSIQRSAHEFVIGPSCLHWDGRALHIDIDEWSVPIPRRIKGRISVYPEQLFNFSTPLDPRAYHHWGPIAPISRVQVNLSNPDQSWSGHGYVDSNEGVEPIANAFTEWDWSRGYMSDGSCAVLYDCQYHSGDDHLLALRFLSNGVIEQFQAPARKKIPNTAWGISRRLRSESALGKVTQLEDTPFYQRAVIENELLGERIRSFHETLNASRFATKWVQALLPWRMPRLYKSMRPRVV